jgi:hypothetical protein
MDTPRAGPLNDVVINRHEALAMDKQLVLRKLVVAVLAAFGASGMALAVDEVEPNHPISSAQSLTITGDAFSGKGGATVNGVIGSLNGLALDADFYTFYGQKGDRVTFDIDGTQGLDSILTVFSPTFVKLSENDDAAVLEPDPGSTSFSDSMIADFELPETGMYTVAVTAYPVTLADGGTYEATEPQSNGAYTLVISGVSLPVVAQPPAPEPTPDPVVTLPPVVTPPPAPPVTRIDIKIRPASVGRTPINPKANSVIPVVLMSSAEFNPLNVDAKTLTFGPTGSEASLRQCNASAVDLNRDGRPDLMCQFDSQLAKFVPGDLMGTLKGKTRDGVAFQGQAPLKATLAKRKR